MQCPRAESLLQGLRNQARKRRAVVVYPSRTPARSASASLASPPDLASRSGRGLLQLALFGGVQRQASEQHLRSHQHLDALANLVHLVVHCEMAQRVRHTQEKQGKPDSTHSISFLRSLISTSVGISGFNGIRLISVANVGCCSRGPFSPSPIPSPRAMQPLRPTLLIRVFGPFGTLNAQYHVIYFPVPRRIKSHSLVPVRTA
jgi:hypothetical protein